MAPRPSDVLKNERGVALLIALIFMTLTMFIVVEVSHDTTVDLLVAQQKVHRIQAFYAAKAGVEISLLRIMLYKQAMAGIGSSLGANKSMLDPIWNFPFMWPPTAMGGKATEVDKDQMKEAVADSLMQNEKYTATISAESGKLDINDLGSDLKSLKKSTIEQVVKIFDAEVKNNEAFQRKYSGFRFDQMVNNIADYIDADSESLNGGDESGPYRDITEKDMQMPPNRPLRTLDELHQVAGMTDDFYKVLAPKVTVYGSKGINVNYAKKEMLLALDPTMTSDVVDKVIARRENPKQGGPFQSDQDFLGFIQGYGVNTKAIQESKIPLLYDMEFNFRIQAVGYAGNVKHTITAVTYDFANLAARFADLMNKQDQLDQGGVGASGGGGSSLGNNNAAAGGGTSTQKIQATKGKPRVVYWEED